MFEMRRLAVLMYLTLTTLVVSCGASTLFYNPNDMCEESKTRKGKFKQKDMDRRAKSSKIK